MGFCLEDVIGTTVISIYITHLISRNATLLYFSRIDDATSDQEINLHRLRSILTRNT